MSYLVRKTKFHLFISKISSTSGFESKKSRDSHKNIKKSIPHFIFRLKVKFHYFIPKISSTSGFDSKKSRDSHKNIKNQFLMSFLL